MPGIIINLENSSALSEKEGGEEQINSWAF